MASADTSTKEKTKAKLDLAKPSMFSVIYMDDNVTTMEFVVASLMAIFNHSEEAANALCMQVHEDGSAVVAVLPYELAEQKGSNDALVIVDSNAFLVSVKNNKVIVSRKYFIVRSV